MQGKSCFNFNKVDEPLMSELEALTRAGYEPNGRQLGVGRAAARRTRDGAPHSRREV
jgi:hypothetical protein